MRTAIENIGLGLTRSIEMLASVFANQQQQQYQQQQYQTTMATSASTIQHNTSTAANALPYNPDESASKKQLL